MGQRKYEKGYKVQAVKLAQEIGAGRAAKELGGPGGCAVRLTEGGAGAVFTVQTHHRISPVFAILYWDSAGNRFPAKTASRSWPASQSPVPSAKNSCQFDWAMI